MVNQNLIPSSQEIYNLYWGEPDRLPKDWLSLEEIADKYNLTIDEVEELLNGVSWERRKKSLEYHKIIWEFLENEWGFEYKHDFDYKVPIGITPVLFSLVNYGIGINLDPTLSWRETKERHYGKYNVIWFSTENQEVLERALTNYFKAYQVIKKRVSEVVEDESY